MFNGTFFCYCLFLLANGGWMKQKPLFLKPSATEHQMFTFIMQNLACLGKYFTKISKTNLINVHYALILMKYF